MQPQKARFVTATQQVLALAVVLAALTPAANVISLDVVPDVPAELSKDQARRGAGGPPAAMAAYAKAASTPSVVPTAAVSSHVREVALTARPGARVAPGALKARVLPRKNGFTDVLSKPQRITGYGAVGVTWSHQEQVADDAITVRARYRQGNSWSGWRPIEYHDDHGPDAASPEARTARPGTDALFVGEVDKVQVKIRARRGAPSDMKLAIIDPGRATKNAKQTGAIDTGSPGGRTAPALATSEATSDGGATDGLALAAAAYTPRPRIYSRAQWGADERLRDKGSLRYGKVQAGFVHHTVNANNYTAAQVPGMLRSIYAYHTRSRGWSDVGYNFLVDRFGRIWEGRAGGVDRAVIGAHTLGYNDNAFAMSAIGNYEIARPTAAVVQAYGALMGWKLSLHGVSATSTRQYVTKRTFPAINGHRDAGSTACPGRYLYAQLPQIRRLASAAQRGWTGRQLESNLAGTAHPDLAVRRASDGRVFIVPLGPKPGGGYQTGRMIPTNVAAGGSNLMLKAGDWDRDGFGDLIFRNSRNGGLYLQRGNGKGSFGALRLLAPGFAAVRMLAAVGDITGDGWPDLMGQPTGGGMRIYPGWGGRGLVASYAAAGAIQASVHVPLGRMGADGAPDSLVRTGPKARIYPSNGPGGLLPARATTLNLSPYDWTLGISDAAAVGGKPDLLLRSRGTGQLWLLQGNAPGTGFGGRQLVGAGLQGFNLVG